MNTDVIDGERPVYPGHGLVVALFIMKAFESPAAALARTRYGWSECVGSSDVPGAGDGAYAGARIVRMLADGRTADACVAEANRGWRGLVGPGTGNLEDAFVPGQEQADRFEQRFREMSETWLRGVALGLVDRLTGELDAYVSNRTNGAVSIGLRLRQALGGVRQVVAKNTLGERHVLWELEISERGYPVTFHGPEMHASVSCFAAVDVEAVFAEAASSKIVEREVAALADQRGFAPQTPGAQ